MSETSTFNLFKYNGDTADYLRLMTFAPMLCLMQNGVPILIFHQDFYTSQYMTVLLKLIRIQVYL